MHRHHLQDVQMRIHVFTLTWNGLEKLKFIDHGLDANLSYITHTEDGELKQGHQLPIWHLRDNGSKDDTIKFFRQREFDSRPHTHTILYDIGHNRDSFATGMNFLFDKAKPADDDVVLLLNNDVVFHGEKNLDKMYKLMQRTGAAVVGTRLLYPGAEKLQHAGVIFSPRYGNMPYHFRPGEQADDNSMRDRYFQAVTAAVCMVRAGSYRRIGGMDEGFKWAFEDIDMCLRIGETEKIVYCGDTIVTHEESASLKKNPVNKLFLASNVGHFKEKWWDGQTPRYVLDHQKYLDDPGYNEIKVH
jgi:GT2 family glycosyltransferase